MFCWFGTAACFAVYSPHVHPIYYNRKALEENYETLKREHARLSRELKAFEPGDPESAGGAGAGAGGLVP